MLASSDWLFVDGTFDTIPQLKVYNKCSRSWLSKIIPFAWMMLGTKLQEVYEGAIRFFFAQVAPQFVPRHVMGDYELGMRGALQALWPSANFHGCFFHYYQALRKQAIGKKHRLKDLIDHEDGHRRILHKFMALALLPPTRIEEGLRVLVSAMTDDVGSHWSTFVEYYERQ
ncbi:PREDICTED: uncharacterized protein LOC108782875 isoform X1 [Cyphomyrmex costatus]|nr:PREDICTED: uncharacterized protein LOC108782875 isoform X1 [Cyphomyrmex costatus]XP_018406774.1 PREDICTED: uncharacterized protein LOC108782875 isoform X1 [Cyphomyrmex costatus]